MSVLISLFTGSFKKRNLLTYDFVEEHDYEKGFKEHYNKHLRPLVKEYESKRLKALNKASIRARICIPTSLIWLCLGIWLANSSSFKRAIASSEFIPNYNYSGVIGFLAILPLIISFVYLSAPITNYKNSVKSKIIPLIMKFFKEFKYSASCNISTYEYRSSQIIPYHTSESNEDLIQGTYKNVSICFYETELKKLVEEEVYVDGEYETSEYYEKVFKGAIIILNTREKFKGHTIILNKNLDQEKCLEEYEKRSQSEYNQFKNVKISNNKFNDVFEARSTNTKQANKLLTPDIIEKIVKIYEMFGKCEMEFSVYADKVIIMNSYSHNAFEPGSISVPENYIDDAKKILFEMNIIFSLVNIISESLEAANKT